MTQGPLQFPFPSRTSIWIVTGLLLLSAGCGKPMSDNAGSQNSLLEDREDCAMEMEQSLAPHPAYMNQVFPVDIHSCQRLLPSSCELPSLDRYSQICEHDTGRKGEAACRGHLLSFTKTVRATCRSWSGWTSFRPRSKTSAW